MKTPVPQPADDDRIFTLAVCLLALLPRLFVAVAWAREPVWDGHYYHFGAQRIAAGLGYSEDVLVRGLPIWKPWCHYPVGYSALLGGVYKIFGSGLVVAPIVNALIGVATVFLVHRLARHFLTPNRARIAAGIAALHPGLITYSAVVMTELLAALLLLGAAWAVTRFGPRWLSVVAAGGVLGLATLVRPSALLAAPLLALALPGPWWKATGRALVATGVALVVVAPWTLRNCRVMDGCALVSTNGGWNLAIGAVHDSGRFETLTAAQGCPVVTGQVQQDRCWAAVGRAAIARDPVRWLALVPKKLGHTWDHESFAVEYLREADPASWPEDRRVAARQLSSSFHRLLLFFAALSVVSAPLFRPRRSAPFIAQAAVLGVLCVFALYATIDIWHPFYWLAVLPPLIALLPLPGAPVQGELGRYLLGLVAATSLTHAIFFGDDRYHLVVTPILCILAAAALRSPGAEPESHRNPAAEAVSSSS